MIDINSLTLNDIDVLLHERVYFSEHDSGQCGTYALVKITLQDRMKRELVFYSEANAEDHDDLIETNEIEFELDRSQYDQILIEQIPIILKEEHAELTEMIEADDYGWRDAIRIVLASKDPDEVHDYTA